MDPITVALGAAAICFGSYTTHLRFADPAKLRKLEPMRERLGWIPGNAVHVTAYSVAPVAAGVTLVLAGLRGASIL